MSRRQLSIQRSAAPFCHGLPSVPASHGFRRNDDQALLPTGPDLPGNNPEEPVEGAKSWPWMAPFQRGKLLTQGQVFEEKTSLRTKEANVRSKAEPEQSEPGPKLYQNPAETMSACLFQDRTEFWRTTGEFLSWLASRIWNHIPCSAAPPRCQRNCGGAGRPHRTSSICRLFFALSHFCQELIERALKHKSLHL